MLKFHLMKSFYRYEAHVQVSALRNMSSKELTYHETESQLILTEYQMISETSKGYWISKYEPLYNSFSDCKRWISKTSKKRFAYPTKEEALTNFIKRKQMSLQHLEQHVARTKVMLKMGKSELELLNESDKCQKQE